MILTAQAVIDRVKDVLLDAGVSWPDAELARWLDDGRSTIYTGRPDVYREEIDFACTPGVRQTLPGNSTRLFEVIANVSHPNRRAITLTAEQVLSRHRPRWRAQVGATEILHYLYDESDGGAFELYPPAAAGVTIRLAYAARPDAITVNNWGSTSLTDEAELEVVLADYVLYRCFQKDSDTNPAYAQRAEAHKAAFDATLMGQAAVKLQSSPNATKPGGEAATGS